MARPRKPDAPAWRETAAGKAAKRAAKRAERRQRYAAMTPAEREALAAELHALQRESQARTAQTAAQHRQPWADWEDAFLRERPSIRLRDAAQRLGRTLYAVETRRRLLRRDQAHDEDAG